MSPRFWQLGAVGLSTGLSVYVETGSWVLGLNAALIAWFLPSVAVGSWDRAQNKKVEAAIASNIDTNTITFEKQ